MERRLRCLLTVLLAAFGVCLASARGVRADIEVVLSRNQATINTGDSLNLTASAGGETVTWISTKESVASVADGKVTAKKAGTTQIIAKAGDETATCEVTVKRSNARTGVYRYTGTEAQGNEVTDSLYVLSRTEGKILFVAEHIEKRAGKTCRVVTNRISVALKGNKTRPFVFKDNRGNVGIGLASFQGKRVTLRIKAGKTGENGWLWPENLPKMTLTDLQISAAEQRRLGRF